VTGALSVVLSGAFSAGVTTFFCDDTADTLLAALFAGGTFAPLFGLAEESACAWLAAFAPLDFGIPAAAGVP
jgi:hypothetical protein